MATETEPTPRDLNELNQEESQRVLQHFRRAVQARITQWDHELSIEKILGREINLDMGELAQVDHVATLTLNDLRDALANGDR